MTTELMPQWAIDRYSEAVRRATTNARKPWRHLFTWEEVESYAWEEAVKIWRSWEAPHIRSPERYATSDLRYKTLNRLAEEARSLGWSRKEFPKKSGKFEWESPAALTELFDTDGPSPAADRWIDGNALSREELKKQVVLLARNYEHLCREVEKMPEARWIRFDNWMSNNDRYREMRFAREVAGQVLEKYGDEPWMWEVKARQMLRDGFSVRQIADQVQVPKSTVHDTLKRAA